MRAEGRWQHDGSLNKVPFWSTQHHLNAISRLPRSDYQIEMEAPSLPPERRVLRLTRYKYLTTVKQSR